MPFFPRKSKYKTPWVLTAYDLMLRANKKKGPSLFDKRNSKTGFPTMGDYIKKPKLL